MEPREVFIDEMPLHERPVGATAESPEEFWEEVEDMDDLYEGVEDIINASDMIEMSVGAQIIFI